MTYDEFKKKYIGKAVDYDDTAVNTVKALQKSWGYKETGEAGENFVRIIYSKLS